jgi:hypothetical protein
MTDKLESILKNAELAHLLPTLIDQGVVDSMLPDLSESDLKSLGVDKLGERKRLLSALTANRSPDKPQSAPAKSFKDEEKKLDAVQEEQVSVKPTSQILAKAKSEVAQPPSTPPPTKPESKILLALLVLFMGPIPLFFVSWKRALLSIFILIISLGIPLSPPAIKYFVFWIGIPLFLLLTKKRA